MFRTKWWNFSKTLFLSPQNPWHIFAESSSYTDNNVLIEKIKFWFGTKRIRTSECAVVYFRFNRTDPDRATEIEYRTKTTIESYYSTIVLPQALSITENSQSEYVPGQWTNWAERRIKEYLWWKVENKDRERLASRASKITLTLN